MRLSQITILDQLTRPDYTKARIMITGFNMCDTGTKPFSVYRLMGAFEPGSLKWKQCLGISVYDFDCLLQQKAIMLVKSDEGDHYIATPQT